MAASCHRERRSFRLVGAGVMLFRGVTWFLPIPVGYLMLWLERRRERRELAQAAAEGAGSGEAAGAAGAGPGMA